MENPTPGFLLFLLFITIWQFFWKIVAIWRSARENQKAWFAVMILLFGFNTLGLPEIVYLFWFAKTKLTVDELISWFHHARKKIRRRKS